MHRILLTLSILLLIPMSGCSVLSDFFTEQPLEFRYVAGFHLDEERKGGQVYLRIGGVSAQSALGVKRIDVIAKGDELVVTPIMALARNRWSGGFFYALAVPPNIKRVVFGEEHYEIWPRIPPKRTDQEDFRWLYEHGTLRTGRPVPQAKTP